MKFDCYKNAFKFKLEMFDLWFRTSLEEFPEIEIFDHSDIRTYTKNWYFDYYLKDSDGKKFNLTFEFGSHTYKTLSEIDLYKFKILGGEINHFDIHLNYTFENVEKFFEILRKTKIENGISSLNF